MDRVPIAFCDHLCGLLSINGLQGAKELSGPYGQIAQCTFEHAVGYICSVKDGIEEDPVVSYEWNYPELEVPEAIEAVPKKFVRDVWIYLLDSEDERVSRKLVKRFPHATYHFVLGIQSINEAWVDFACSLNRLQRVAITKKLDDDALRLFQRLITSRKLFALMLHPKACEGAAMELPKSLFFQDQFEELRIQNPNGAPWRNTLVREVLEFWSENGDRLRGKHFVMDKNCESGIEQLEEFLLRRTLATVCPTLLRVPAATLQIGRIFLVQRALEVCSKEECDLIDKEYRHNHTTFRIPSCVYKYEEGGETQRRRLYFSFECDKYREWQHLWRPASHNGHKDFTLMRNTSSLHILFA
uniref:FBA_2 domain-containing protein n=1 Tax=Steinernema glaseri TaxID=37863 RepID=A0A1I8AD34_9BILA